MSAARHPARSSAKGWRYRRLGVPSGERLTADLDGFAARVSHQLAVVVLGSRTLEGS